jgi:hypothetical protein
MDENGFLESASDATCLNDVLADIAEKDLLAEMIADPV